jgi:hypothetical protein
MFKKFLVLGPVASMLVATEAIVADSTGARLMIPIQGTYSGDKFAGEAGTVESITPSGYSLQYVASAGWELDIPLTVSNRKKRIAVNT